MRANYCRGVHPCQVECKATDSAVWRRMVSIRQQVELSMFWLVRDGSCHFWYDNWTGSGALCLKVSVVPALSTFPEVRQERSRSFMFSQIWQPWIPIKVSFFMLRLLLGRLPLDDALCKLGFAFPSKCSCCLDADGESLEHVFSLGQVAAEVWSYFARACGVTSVSSVLRDRIGAWWLAPQRSRERRVLFTTLPSLICWHIWKARNRAVYEGIRACTVDMVQAIFRDLQLMVELRFQQSTGVQSFRQLLDWSA